MILIGKQLLTDFGAKHSDAGKSLEAWRKVVETANWHHLQQVRDTYPTADGGVKGIYTVFNIKKNRVITQIDYDLQTVLICFVFTHDDYDHWNKHI